MTKNDSTGFDENNSLDTIKAMITVARKRSQEDGILMIVWGWIMFASVFFGAYLPRRLFMPHQAERVLSITGTLLPLAGLGYTIYYLFGRRDRVRTYIGISIRYTWGALFISMVLVNLIQFNVLGSINFALQHPIFMVLIAFAVVVTGGILRYGWIIAGGVIFGVLALLSSWLPLAQQLLLESAGWIVSFALPGHILFAKRNKG